jgi:hypothetical protein
VVERHRLVRRDQTFDVLARLAYLGERHHLDVVELDEGRSRVTPGGEDLQGVVPCGLTLSPIRSSAACSAGPMRSPCSLCASATRRASATTKER